jgi:hypothetical protein
MVSQWPNTTAPRARGQGAHTLNEPTKLRKLIGGWWTVLDRWGDIPRGYAIMVCGCPVYNLAGELVGSQRWVLPRNPWRGRPPVSSPTGREGDIHPLCGKPFERVG